MRLLAPDLLELTCELSPAIDGVAILVGLFLWLFGARSHRFWLSLAMTLAAGVCGLYLGGDAGVQPLVAGLLLALAAGVMALALARLVLFFAGGLAGLIIAQQGGEGWNAFAMFLFGGLSGVLFYRVWIMVVSCLAGTLLSAYGLLSLLDRLGRLEAVELAERHGPLLNWLLALVAVVGLLIQVLLERRWGDRGEGKGKSDGFTFRALLPFKKDRAA